MNNEVYFLELKYNKHSRPQLPQFFVVGQQNNLFATNLNEVLQSYSTYLSNLGAGGAVNCISVVIKTKDLIVNEWKRQVKLCNIYLLNHHIVLSFDFKLHSDNFNPQYMYAYNVSGVDEQETLSDKMDELTNCVIKNVSRLFHSQESKEFLEKQLNDMVRIDDDGCCFDCHTPISDSDETKPTKCPGCLRKIDWKKYKEPVDLF